MFQASKTYRPMVALERSPFYPDVIMGVTDWAVYIWKEGLKQHFFQSPSPPNYFTAGCWSPTRAGVVFLARVDGSLEIWDFSDQTHRPSLAHPVGSSPISNIQFLPSGSGQRDMVAVGDEQGYLRVLQLPKNLVKPAGKEQDAIQRLIQREEERVLYFSERPGALDAMRAEMEKQEQQGGQAETKADQDKLDKKAEAEYQQLQKDFCEQLGISG